MRVDFATHLLREQLLRPDQVDDLLQLQVVMGGALDTHILEAELLREARVLRALGDAHRMPPISRDEIDDIPQKMPDIFPRAFAETYNMIPYRLIGRNLGVIVAEPPDDASIMKLEQRLKIRIVPAVTTEARLYYAMRKLYDATIPPRMEALLERLDASAAAQLIPEAPIRASATLDATQDEFVVRPPPGAVTTTKAVAASASPAAVAIAGAPVATAPGAPAGEAVVVAHGPVFQRESRGLVPERAEPMDLDTALVRMQLARDRDQLIDLALGFANQAFKFSGLFLLQGNAFVGYRGRGDDESALRIPRVMVPLILQSMFRTVHETRGHYLGSVPDVSLNATILQDLGRAAPRIVFLAPLVISGKLVGILYCDNGKRGVASRKVADLLVVLTRLGPAFEKMIQRRKAEVKVAAGALSQSVDKAAKLKALAVAAPSEPLNEATFASLSPALPEQQVPDDPDEADEQPGEEPVSFEEPAGLAPPALVKPVVAQAAPHEALEAIAPVDALGGAAPAAVAPDEEVSSDPFAEAAPQPPRASSPETVPMRAFEFSSEEPTIAITFNDGETSKPIPATDLLSQRFLNVLKAAAEEEDEDDNSNEESIDVSDISAEALLGKEAPPPPPVSAAPAFRAPELAPIATEAPSYKAFAEFDAESEEETVEGWEDVLVDTIAAGKQGGTAQAEAAAPQAPSDVLGWDDILVEATAAAAATDAATSQTPPPLQPKLDDLAVLLDAMDSPDAEAARRATESLWQRREALGDKLLDVLGQRFPGRLGFDPFGQSTLPPLVELSPVVRLLVALGPQALGVVMPHLESQYPAHRLIATAFFGQVVSGHAFSKLLRRLFDDEPRVREVAADTLRKYARLPGYDDGLAKIRERLGMPLIEGQIRAVEILGRLRDTGAVPLLIPLLPNRRPELSNGSLGALMRITAQDFAHNPKKWTEWWVKHSHEPREKWLVEGLRRKEPILRVIADEELRLLTGLNFHFDPAADRRDQEASIKAWEAWWAHEERTRAVKAAYETKPKR